MPEGENGTSSLYRTRSQPLRLDSVDGRWLKYKYGALVELIGDTSTRRKNSPTAILASTIPTWTASEAKQTQFLKKQGRRTTS